MEHGNQSVFGVATGEVKNLTPPSGRRFQRTCHQVYCAAYKAALVPARRAAAAVIGGGGDNNTAWKAAVDAGAAAYELPPHLEKYNRKVLGALSAEAYSAAEDAANSLFGS